MRLRHVSGPPKGSTARISKKKGVKNFFFPSLFRPAGLSMFWLSPTGDEFSSFFHKLTVGLQGVLGLLEGSSGQRLAETGRESAFWGPQHV